MRSYDLVIVGGGMVGLTLAMSLKNSGFSIAVIDSTVGEQQVAGNPELRVSALSLASQNILDAVGAWNGVTVQRLQAYEQMQVWEKDSFSKLNFDCQSVHQDYLGHIVENKAVRSALWQQVQSCESIDLLAPKKIQKLVFGAQESFINLDDDTMLTARLVVGADGANSYVRKQADLPITFWDYDHTAIVATIQTEFPHNNTARQIFSSSGPLAFLPLWEDNLCSIVWSQQTPIAKDLLKQTPVEFNKRLTAAFDARLGLCELVSERQSFPLKMRYARNWVKDRVVLIGDAAHTIHPLAGQGVNLGMQDAAALAQHLMELKAQDLDLGLGQNLRSFERWRKTEATKMIATMEGFKQLFSGDNPIKKLVRDIGMSAVDKLPLAKDMIIKQAMGLEGELPELAKVKLD